MIESLLDLLREAPGILWNTLDLVDAAIAAVVFIIFLRGGSYERSESLLRNWRRGLRWAVGSLFVLGIMKVNHEQFTSVQLSADAARAAESLAMKEAEQLEAALLEKRPNIRVTVARFESGAFIEWDRVNDRPSARVRIRVQNVTPYENAATHYWVQVFYKPNRSGSEELHSDVHFDIYKDRYAIVDRKLPPGGRPVP